MAQKGCICSIQISKEDIKYVKVLGGDTFGDFISTPSGLLPISVQLMKEVIEERLLNEQGATV